MPKRTGDFNAWHLEKLSNPEIAANYLDTIWNNSRELFLDAVKDVIQANQVSSVAKKVGLQRESLYRSFSSHTGNPTATTMQAVLAALGVEYSGVRPIAEQSKARVMSAGTRKRHKRRKTAGTNYQQLLLPLWGPSPSSAKSDSSRVAPIEQHNKGALEIADVLPDVAVLPGFLWQQQGTANCIVHTL